MGTFFLKIAMGLLNILYLPMKIFPVRRKILFISRQSDTAPLDFSLILQSLSVSNPEIQTVLLTKKLRTKKGNILNHFFFVLKQMYHLATTTVVILDGYSIPVSVLHHKRSLKVIQLWHASTAVKKFGWATVGKSCGHKKNIATAFCMHHNYDYVFTSSKRTAGFYSQAFHTTMDKMVYIGAPHLQLLKDRSTEKNLEILASFPALKNGKKTILYIPTFRSNCSLELLPLNKLIDYENYNLVLKKHPIDEQTVVPAEIILAEEFGPLEWINFADIIITDYSSLVIEVAILNKPLYLYVYDYAEYSKDPGLYIDYFQEGIGKYAFEKPDIFPTLLNESYDYKVLEEFRNKYVQVNPDTALNDTVDFIERLL